MNIALYGINGTYNFGCEAIVRGARKFIRDVYPDANIIYFSYSYDYDKKALADLDLEIKPVIENRRLIKRIINKGLILFRMDYRLFYFNQRQMLRGIDSVLSIGGDIYTIPSVLRDREMYPYYNHLNDYCNRAISMGKQVIVYGASVGPWGSYKKAVNYYKKNMLKYKAILCRDHSSIKYLNNLGFSNISFVPDPAFQLGTGEHKEGKYIGVNLSPLSLNELYGNHNDVQQEKLSRLLDEIYTKFHRPLLFLPHVLSKDENDNDLWFMQKIKRRMRYKDNVLIADSSKGFLGIKEQIKECYIVISARMHCAINALEENVPTIFLSYSQKSIGMCEYVYGCKEWVIELKNVEQKLMNTVERMMEQHDSMVNLLIVRNKKIKKDYYSSIDEVKKLLW